MFRLDDPENSLRVISDISIAQTWFTVFTAPPNADVGARIRIETDRYLGPTSPVVCAVSSLFPARLIWRKFRFNFKPFKVVRVPWRICAVFPSVAMGSISSGICPMNRTGSSLAIRSISRPSKVSLLNRESINRRSFSAIPTNAIISSED